MAKRRKNQKTVKIDGKVYKGGTYFATKYQARVYRDQLRRSDPSYSVRMLPYKKGYKLWTRKR